MAEKLNTFIINSWRRVKTQMMLNPKTTRISLYNKPLINSLSLVSHIYIITTIYLCCHTLILANFRHTERGVQATNHIVLKTGVASR